MTIHEYETTLIFHPEAPEEEIARVTERLDGVITSFAGTKLFQDSWGVRKLAYAIRKQARGHYIHLGFVAKAASVAELERILRIESTVMRFLTVHLNENVDAEECMLNAQKRVRILTDRDDSDEQMDDRDRDDDDDSDKD
ncbi:MAG: 30S ribosomal protein S6 [Pseudomonadota bacterium]